MTGDLRRRTMDPLPRLPYIASMTKLAANEVEIDRVARAMATGAGIAWDGLDTYPGYKRGYWRGEARLLLGRIAAGDLPGRI